MLLNSVVKQKIAFIIFSNLSFFVGRVEDSGWFVAELVESKGVLLEHVLFSVRVITQIPHFA